MSFQKRREFWNGFLSAAKRLTDLYARNSTTANDWLQTSTGIQGVVFTCKVREHGTQVMLNIDNRPQLDEKQLFDRLARHRIEIEAAFGEQLIWDKKESRRICRIRKEIFNGGLKDEKKWPQIYSITIKTMLRLEMALQPYLKGLKAEDRQLHSRGNSISSHTTVQEDSISSVTGDYLQKVGGSKSVGEADTVFGEGTDSSKEETKSMGEKKTVDGKIETISRKGKEEEIDSRYEVVKILGEGGMGRVYRCLDRKLNREVAVKRLLPGLGASRMDVKRFLREGQAIGGLDHTNLVRVHDVGKDENGHYIVMELIEGKSLREMIRERGRLSVDEAKEIAGQVGRALAYAHSRGVVHRDIKPGNIMLAGDGTAKITDFGLAHIGLDGSDLTQTGSGLGTYDYMPPEQMNDAKHTDHRVDIYSFGATIYEMVTGRSPRLFRESDIPKEIKEVVLIAMEHDVEARYKNVDDMLRALKEAERLRIGSKGASRRLLRKIVKLLNTPIGKRKAKLAARNIVSIPTSKRLFFALAIIFLGRVVVSYFPVAPIAGVDTMVYGLTTGLALSLLLGPKFGWKNIGRIILYPCIFSWAITWVTVRLNIMELMSLANRSIIIAPLNIIFFGVIVGVVLIKVLPKFGWRQFSVTILGWLTDAVFFNYYFKVSNPDLYKISLATEPYAWGYFGGIVSGGLVLIQVRNALRAELAEETNPNKVSSSSG